MAEKQLTYSQQLALLPVSIPDAVLDFLEELQLANSLQTEIVREGFDPKYLEDEGEKIRFELDILKKELGKPLRLNVELGTNDEGGIYYARVDFQNGIMGVGFATRIKERTIQKVYFKKGEISEAEVKDISK